MSNQALPNKHTFADTNLSHILKFNKNGEHLMRRLVEYVRASEGTFVLLRTLERLH